MKVTSRLQQHKLILPFVLGFAIVLLLYLIWSFSYMLEKGDLPENATFNLFLILLIVESQIAIVEIALVYRARVVKMKPKSSYDLGSIDDYLTIQGNFRNGNYEYETIKSIIDIHRAYYLGKKIIFTERRFSVAIWVGIIFSMIGLIISSAVVLVLDIIDHSEAEIAGIMLFVMFNAAFSGLGVPFSIYSFIKYVRAPRSFFILAPEGIIYRRSWGGVRVYSWKELDLEVYTVTTTVKRSISLWRGSYTTLKTEYKSGYVWRDFQWDVKDIAHEPSLEIRFILPNGSRLKFHPGDFDLSEFLNLDKLEEKLKEGSGKKRIFEISSRIIAARASVLPLVFFAFKYYYFAAKGKNDLDEEK